MTHLQANQGFAPNPIRSRARLLATAGGLWKPIYFHRFKVQGLGPSREGALRTWRVPAVRLRAATAEPWPCLASSVNHWADWYYRFAGQIWGAPMTERQAARRGRFAGERDGGAGLFGGEDRRLAAVRGVAEAGQDRLRGLLGPAGSLPADTLASGKSSGGGNRTRESCFVARRQPTCARVVNSARVYQEQAARLGIPRPGTCRVAIRCIVAPRRRYCVAA